MAARQIYNFETKLDIMRRKRGYSINFLCDSVGVDYKYYYRVNKKEVVLTCSKLFMLLKFCDVLNCKLSDIVDSDDPNYNLVKNYDNKLLKKGIYKE